MLLSLLVMKLIAAPALSQTSDHEKCGSIHPGLYRALTSTLRLPFKCERPATRFIAQLLRWLAPDYRSGDWAATMFTICQSCHLVDLDPFKYMVEIMAELHTRRQDCGNVRPKSARRNTAAVT